LVDIALRHGFKPSDFGICPPEYDREMVIAYADTIRKMEAVEHFIIEVENDKQTQ